MGIVEEAMEKREARRNKPQPWIMRKLAVFMTIGIIAYAWYVYVGQLCVPMIRRDPASTSFAILTGISSTSRRCLATTRNSLSTSHSPPRR